MDALARKAYSSNLTDAQWTILGLVQFCPFLGNNCEL
jgi:hypothetical protein